jgi:hypothetical protein
VTFVAKTKKLHIPKRNKKGIQMKFKLQHKNGGKVAYRATDYWSFQQDLDAIPTQEICDYTFFIDGKLTTFEIAEKVVAECINAFIAKRSETKKQVWARKQGTQGNFKNNFHQIWVNK